MQSDDAPSGDDPSGDRPERSSSSWESGAGTNGGDHTDRGAGPRGSLELLLDRRFGPYFLGQVLSIIGVWIHNIVAAIVVWELTHSAFWVGLVSVGQFLPQFVLAPWGGALADRHDRRRMLILGWSIKTAGSGGLAIWIALFGLGGYRAAAAVVLWSSWTGIGLALGGPAMNALLPALVEREDLPSAVAMAALPMTVARSVGPALGAMIFLTIGPSWAFGVAAVLNVAFIVIIARVKARGPTRAQGTDQTVRAGLRYLRHDSSMVSLLLGVVAVGVGIDPIITLTPAIAAELGRTADFVGTMASAFGVGAALGFLILGPLRRLLGTARLAVAGLAGLALAMLGLSVANSASGSIVTAMAGGLCMTFALTSLTSMIQDRVPEEFRGRIMSIWGIAFIGSRPIAAGVSGWIADVSSVRGALLVIAAVLALGAAVSRPSKISRSCSGGSGPRR